MKANPVTRNGFFCGGCTTVRTSNAAVCRVQFDYTDSAIDGLNMQNLRALSSFKDLCVR